MPGPQCHDTVHSIDHDASFDESQERGDVEHFGGNAMENISRVFGSHIFLSDSVSLEDNYLNAWKNHTHSEDYAELILVWEVPARIDKPEGQYHTLIQSATGERT